jgi:hypothetical protein
MAGSYGPQSNPGMMIPTTSVWDVSQIYAIENITPELKELLVRLYQNLNNMAIAVNLKDTGYYTLQEFLSSQAFFPNPINTAQSATTPVFRQAFRKVINIGALPNTATLQIPHYININNGYSFTRIYGAATQSEPFVSIPLPYSSVVLNQNIDLWIDDTYVNIVTGINYSAYNISYVIVEYLKS